MFATFPVSREIPAALRLRTGDYRSMFACHILDMSSPFLLQHSVAFLLYGELNRYLHYRHKQENIPVCFYFFMGYS